MQNPFGPNRIEYESRPVLWFSKKAADISNAAKPVFVAGTRGSGKTSILRSMSTLHILDDQSLAEQIGSLHWYGVFFQLNETFSPLIDNAVLSLIPEHIRLDPEALRNRQFVIFSHYLELKIVERFLETLGSLRREGHLDYSATDDRGVAFRINRDVLHFLKFEGNPDFFGLDELKFLVSRYIERCFNAFFMGGRGSDSPFFATDPGSILSRVVSEVSPLIKGSAFQAKPPIKLKIMIDDCEVLTPLQQQFLNTIVRKTRGEVKWVLAYIGGLYDTIRTVIPGQSLSNADRDVENLDSVSDKEFAQLCQNVASLRLFYALPDKARDKLKIKHPLTAFSLKRRLGVISLNQILERVIQSASPESSEGRQKLIRIADEAREFFELNMTRAQLGQLTPNSKARPYVEGLALSQMPDKERERRVPSIDVKALQRILARKQGWAFLEACRMLRLHEYPYVGHQIIIQLSDLCIRDFLDIMGEIYSRAVGRSASISRILDFINSETEISIEQQRQAVISASEKKLQGLESLAQPFEEESVRMVRALGRLTTKLQTESDENDFIGTTERGLFSINRSELRSIAAKMELPDSKIDEVLKRAEKDGFIREVSERGKLESPYENPDSTEVTVRLHRRFAPHFRFSYRGPYVANALPAWRVVELLLTRKQTPEDWADSVFKEIGLPVEDWSHLQRSLFDDGTTNV
ncbi:hypothetical protein FG93_01112 [Bosea sp. LC85]|uniref:ORC-CDC6 family AAA ATPase n=1 Tax=Bosea sp. LC85 TaxID=1502851 RepID=UPI0004E3CBC8|nr:hypothetical protein [Bosea sp. LC85]KFC74526.1 hypothetical protein FG93_01112 [Bosea sp. LC85]